ncbi:MAG TPA: SH3 domain-containing protein [Gammaproteobacteria bacterium]|nr:SH3 domain-containing protein [Gammaproteobacteria bacterium]
MSRWLGLCAILLILGAVHAAAVATAQTVVAGNLTSGPYSDASVVAAVPNGAAVTVIERQGGWYHVKTAAGQDGWLPMTAIRYNSTTSGTAAAPGTDWASLFSSGREGSGGSTATTGVRGLNTGDIANAKPDIQAVQSLDKYQAKPEQAKAFAAKVPLKANPKIGWLPEVKP